VENFLGLEGIDDLLAFTIGIAVAATRNTSAVESAFFPVSLIVSMNKVDKLKNVPKRTITRMTGPLKMCEISEKFKISSMDSCNVISELRTVKV
jgi:hypothetical protein